MSLRALNFHSQTAPPVPIDEAERLCALHATGILDTDRDPAFDRLTRLAASVFGTRFAFVSFIDHSRQWIKSSQGVEVAETPRDVAFCAYTILVRDVMVVLDTLEDDRFCNHSAVVGGLKLRFYVGVPIISPDGHHIGSFCIADTKPRKHFSDADKLTLATLAEMVSEITEEFRYSLVAQATQDGVWDWDVRRKDVYYSTRWQQVLGLGEIAFLAPLEHWTDRIHPDDREAVLEDLEKQLKGQVTPFRNEHRIRSGNGTWRSVVVRGASQRSDDGKTVRIAGSLMDVTQEKTAMPSGMVTASA